MKIFGWAADNGGPAWYRLSVPLEELGRHGHDVTVSTEMPDWALTEADVVVGQRVCQPGATTRWRRLAGGLYGHRPLMVFELDDDLWDIDPANLPAWNFYRRSPGLLDNLAECAKLADVCTVSTEPLADVVRRYNSNVIVLPNQLPALAYNMAMTRSPSRMRIGWGGGASHLLDVEEMTSGLRQHFRRRPRDTFVNMGTLFDTVRRSVGESLDHLPWTTDMSEHYRRVAGLDIGLAPLRPSPFSRSKSEIKFLEYAAAGVPTIASMFGPYEREASLSRGAMLVRQPHNWTGALDALAGGHEMREELGGLARIYAELRCISQHWQGWERVYLG